MVRTAPDVSTSSHRTSFAASTALRSTEGAMVIGEYASNHCLTVGAVATCGRVAPHATKSTVAHKVHRVMRGV